MSVKRTIVEVDLKGLNVAEFCRQHDVSRALFYRLRKRFAVEGEGALVSRSRAARRVANRTSDVVEDLVVGLRKQLTDDGLDAGPATIRFHLESRLDPGMVMPSEATIWRILKRRGFVTPNPKKAPKHAYRTFQAERANECWQLDDITWPLAGGIEVKIITMIDDCTRICPGLTAVATVNAETALQAFMRAVGDYGLPERFLSDNAKAYKHSLAEAVAALGVDHRHGRPHHPQTQGKVERFNQTLQKWLRTRRLPKTLPELQALLDQFVEIYNHQRPHRSKGRRPPAIVYAQTPKSGPANSPLTTTGVHQVTIAGGIAHINKTYAITIGNKYDLQQATVIITGHNCHIFIAGKLIRHLELDPTRRYQPLHPRPGRPTT